MTRGIYCYIDRKDSSIVYVGKDSSIETRARHRDHHSPSRYDRQKINKILQNNPDRYMYHVLTSNVECDMRLNALEVQYIRQLRPKFNFTEGGDGVSSLRQSQIRSRMDNTTGFLHVSKEKKPLYRQGFTWRYRSKIHNANIRSKNLLALQWKVIEAGLPWQIVDENKASLSIRENHG